MMIIMKEKWIELLIEMKNFFSNEMKKNEIIIIQNTSKCKHVSRENEFWWSILMLQKFYKTKHNAFSWTWFNPHSNINNESLVKPIKNFSSLKKKLNFNKTEIIFAQFNSMFFILKSINSIRHQTPRFRTIWTLSQTNGQLASE